jgi:hypothetical protein
MERLFSQFPISKKEAILIVINLISLIFLFVILSKLPKVANDLRQARIINAKDDASISFEYNKTVSFKPDLDKLSALFLDDAGVVSFVNAIEKLKSSNSAIQKVSFTAQKAVKDRTGNYGIPVVIELSGTWDQIGSDLEHIQTLPYLYRAVTFESHPTVGDRDIVDVKYGILLYVAYDASK